MKSITGYRQFKQRPNIHDLSGSGGPLFTAPQLMGLLTGDIEAVFDPANAPGADDRPFNLLTARSTRQKQFTEELQGMLTTDQFELTFGGFYFWERSPSLNVLDILQPSSGGQLVAIPIDTTLDSGVNENTATNNSITSYAQGTFYVSDTFDISLGGRYTHDKRKTQLTRIGSTGTALGGTLPAGTYNESFNRFT